MNGIKLTKTLSALFLSAALAVTVYSPLSLASAPVKDVKQAFVTSMININTADVQSLISLPGIGPKKAQQILSYRKLNGNFKRVEELSNVKGIGPKMLAKIAGKISVK